MASRTALRTLAPRAYKATAIRYASTSAPTPATPATPGAAAVDKDGKKLSAAPIPLTHTPAFPAPSDPFHPAEAEPQKSRYSATTVGLVKGLAKLMGYHSKTSTAIRETGRMMKGVVETVERDRAFWYGHCNLPQTYQSFFQLHLLHVLLLLPRLRALPSTQYAAYQSELLNHFFELSESEMRRVLGRGERERVVRKYMDDMGQQWKGAGVGLDAIMGMGTKDIGSDVELAAWIWRNLFQAKSILSVPPAPSEASRPGMTIASFVKTKEAPTPVDVAEATNEALEKANDFGPVAGDLEFVETLETIVRFARKEMSRLGRLSDEDVMQGEVGEWGSPK